MNDISLIEYLRKSGMGKQVDDALREVAIEHITKHPKVGKDDMEVIQVKEAEEAMEAEHFTQEQARELVSQMYHCHGGRKYVGEKYCMKEAQEILDKYRGMIPSTATVTDIYIAINAQYHDYAVLFKSWFGSDIDDKIIEAALIFWFYDQDYKYDSKVYKYFHN